MEKLERLKKSLTNIGSRPVLLWSGGLDSTLILAVMKDIGAKFDIFQAREMWTRAQKRKIDNLIKHWDLQVYSYPMTRANFIGQGKEISAVFEYAIGNLSFPHIRDVIEGDSCIAELAELERAAQPPIIWDLHIIGTRQNDNHYAVGNNQMIPSARFEIEGTKFFAPLFDWTRSEVKEALAFYGLDNVDVSEAEDTGNISLCSKCLHGEQVFCPKEQKLIESVDWNAESNLQAFRQTFNF